MVLVEKVAVVGLVEVALEELELRLIPTLQKRQLLRRLLNNKRKIRLERLLKLLLLKCDIRSVQLSRKLLRRRWRRQVDFCPLTAPWDGHLLPEQRLGPGMGLRRPREVRRVLRDALL